MSTSCGSSSPAAVRRRREWVRQHVDAVRGNADATQQAYAQLSAAIKNNPLEGEQLEEIGQQYSRVLEICDRLDQACTEATVDTAIMSQVFDQLQSSLSGARAAHQELASVLDGQR